MGIRSSMHLTVASECGKSTTSAAADAWW